jgi:3-dehydroquinate dehydratase-2
MTKPIYVLNGPNLNLLGTREPEIYGNTTLRDIEESCSTHALELGLTIVFRQTNHEGELVDWVQEARHSASGLILNAGAYTHTSVALHDALKSFNQPAVEVHISNPYKREPFRHTSYVSPAVTGVICGLGAQGYVLALGGLARLLKTA